jgi:hypothetical protein
LATGDDEGRGKLRKILGRRKRPVIQECPNGATRHVEDMQTKVVNLLN